MTHTRFAAHSFSSYEDTPFDVKDYSRLKFGCDATAKKFGYQLAESFFAAHSDKLLANHCVVIPSPYNFVKNAATVMTLHFVDRINELCVEANGRHVEYCTIARKVSYTADYGFLSKEKRKGLINQDTFYINREQMRGKLLIFIDDVRITGAHEEKLVDVLATRRLKNDAMFLYFAEYFGDQPEVEAQLNFSAVQSPLDYVELTKTEDHHLIVRPIKYLLGQDESNFSLLLEKLTPKFLQKLYFAAVSEGYFSIPLYQSNLAALKVALGR